MKKKVALLLAYLFFWTLLPARPAQAVPVVKDLIVKETPYHDVRAVPGATATNATVQAAVTAATAGSTVLIPASFGPYTFSDNVTISKPLTILSDEAVINVAVGKKGFVIASDNVTIQRLNIVGAQSAANNDAEHGISIVGTSSTYYNNLKIQNNTVRRFGGYGIYVKHVRDFDVSHNVVSDIDYGGIMFISSDHGIVEGNRVSNILASGGNGYGIVITAATESDANAAPSRDVVISGNYVRDIPVWTGLDSHGGVRLSFIGNVIDNCGIGMGIGSTDNTDNLPWFAPKEITIAGNSISSGKTDGSAIYGISFTGAYNSGVIDNATGVISRNIVKGFGDQSSAIGNAIYVHSTSGVSITGNAIVEPSGIGILLNGNNGGFSVTGNTIVDAWSNDQSGTGIRLVSVNNTGSIVGNVMSRGAKVATSVNAFGVYFDNEATNVVYVGINDFSVSPFPYYEAGSSTTLHGVFRSATATYDPPSLADNTAATTTVNVVGAKVGDIVTCSHSSNTVAGLIWEGLVSASGVTKCSIYNRSGVTMDVETGTLYVTATRP